MGCAAAERCLLPARCLHLKARLAQVEVLPDVGSSVLGRGMLDLDRPRVLEGSPAARGFHESVATPARPTLEPAERNCDCSIRSTVLQCFSTV